ncbi:hypothetical protein ACIP98_00050 [Streptomyces sp. NPDC088354]|uniref:hypothetical protein n=1 Tax=unclassified Streptomyces TaxID=2593676 RepID=UPI0029A4666B|nr:hypothetical protein [Streptomyces sp. MI02-7b]MDX3076354.1 hypothetical protein [Streptomyces sp. MI02-7b]
MIRRTVAAVVAAFLLPTGPAGTAFADSAAPGRQPRGEVVRGRPSTADAPQLTAGVLYRDTLPPGGEARHYAVQLDAEKSAYLAVFALPGPGSEVAFGDGVDLSLESTDGTRCDSDHRTFSGDGAARPLGTWVKRTIGADEPCQEAHAYVLSVTRRSAATSDPAPWPLQIRLTTEPPLVTGATPGPAVSAGTRPPAPAAGTARGVAGGSDVAGAAELGAGVWKDEVPPGQTRFYEVPVDWGREAWIDAEFANAPVTKAGGFAASGVRVELYNPRWGFVGGAGGAYSGKQTSVTATTGKVAYANRWEPDERVSAARFAGPYYVAVTVHRDVAGFVRGPIPVTLRVGLEGEAQAAPRYDGDPTADLGLPGEESSGGESALRLAGFASLGAGSVLLLSLAVWVASARRRTGA